jgi:hypothetical protein
MFPVLWRNWMRHQIEILGMLRNSLALSANVCVLEVRGEQILLLWLV